MSESTPTCVVIDDHDLIREGLKFRLEHSGAATVIGAAATIAEGEALIASLKPDIAMIDVRLPDGDGIGFVSHCRAIGLDTPVLMISGEIGPPLIEAALLAGANGFVSKLSSTDILIAAVHTILKGQHFIDPAVAYELIEYRQHHLSEREQQILELVVSGQQNAQIAYELKISQETVKTHVSHILTKLDVQSRTEAVVKCLRKGLVL
jgi:DNA-binding NarL/FixJ family response regulator